LDEQRTAELRRSGIAALGQFFNIDRIPAFDIRHSVFDIQPARNALKQGRGKFNTLTLRSLEGEGGNL
jgi:hypothetical protein